MSFLDLFSPWKKSSRRKPLQCKEKTAGIDIHGLPVVIRRRRGKRGITLRIKSDMKIYASVGLQTSEQVVLQFVKHKQAWILKHKETWLNHKLPDGEFYFLGQKTSLVGPKDDIYLARGREFLPKRLEDLCETFPLKPKNVRVKIFKSRWGSCTQHGTISLNARLMAAPLWVIDSVIIHELCHLKHMNHSNEFWQMVEKFSPWSKQANEWLKNHLFHD